MEHTWSEKFVLMAFTKLKSSICLFFLIWARWSFHHRKLKQVLCCLFQHLISLLKRPMIAQIHSFSRYQIRLLTSSLGYLLASITMDAPAEVPSTSETTTGTTTNRSVPVSSGAEPKLPKVVAPPQHLRKLPQRQVRLLLHLFHCSPTKSEHILLGTRYGSCINKNGKLK